MSELFPPIPIERKARPVLNRVQRTLAGTLALTLAFGLASCKQNQDSDNHKHTTPTATAAEPGLLTEISKADRTSITKRYNDLQKYWVSKGVKADSELVIVSADNSFDCGAAGTIRSNTLRSMTCKDDTGKKTIAISALNYNSVVSKTHSSQTATDYIVAHEYGHVVADTIDNGNSPGGLAGELQAECLGAAGQAHTNRGGASDVKAYIRQSYKDNGDNYNPVKALQAYDIGFNARNPLAACAVDKMVALANQ